MTTAIKLDNFTRAYITAALWSSTDSSTEAGGEPLDRKYTLVDIAPEALETIAADCARFLAEQRELISEACSLPGYQDIFDLYREECEGGDIIALAGHDFWLTRNGHGAGFWDRDLGPVGDKLSDAARAFGECNLYIGDDKQIWLM